MFEVGVISLQPHNCAHNLHLSASYFPSLCMSPTWDLGAVGNSLHILNKLSCSCLIDFFPHYYSGILKKSMNKIVTCRCRSGPAASPALEREKQLKGLCSWSLLRSSVSVSPSLSRCGLCFHSRKINVLVRPLARNFIV